MNGQQLIDLGRQLSYYTDTNEYTDEKALTDLNIVYKDLIAQVNQDVNEDLFATDFYTSSVNGALEYTLPQRDIVNSKPGMDNLLGVFINYAEPVDGDGTITLTNGSNVIIGSGTNFTGQFRIGNNIIIGNDFYRVVDLTSDTLMTIAVVDSPLPTSTQSGLIYQAQEANYLKCYPERLSNLEFDQTYYLEHQPKENPFYIKYDTGVRIFPMATQNVIGAVKLYGTYDVLDLTLSTSPIIDETWHYVLAIGMKRFSYQRRGLQNEANNAISEYQVELRKVINTLSDSELSPLLRYLPTLIQFQ